MTRVSGTFREERWPRVMERAKQLLVDGACSDRTVALVRAAFEVSPETGELEELATPAATEMLQLYFHLIDDNDRWPPACQLSLENLGLIRNTLLDFFGAQQQVEENVGEVFRLVQEKMEEGKISQAWNLLQVFDYDQDIKVNNERNLFLEEMALRFKRRVDSRLTEPKTKELEILGREAADDLDRSAIVLSWLREEIGVDLVVLRRDSKDVEHWKNLDLGEGGAHHDESSSPPDILAPFRWRTAVEFGSEAEHENPDRNGAEIIRAVKPHDAAIASHTRRLLQAAYFIALLNDVTGYESFLLDFFRWYRTTIAGASGQLISDVHRFVNLMDMTVREAVDESCEQHIDASLSTMLAQLDDDEIDSALRSFFSRLSRVEAGSLSPGSYALHSFVIDDSLGLKYSDPSVQWRVHRLL